MQNDVAVQNKSCELLNVVRLVLSFVAVLITTSGLSPYMYPWVRVAIPLFFIIYSYSFFKKVNARRRRSSKRQELSFFVWRNVKLYFFWFLVLSPIILIEKKSYFLSQGITGMINLVLNFFIGSTFTSSWFFSALIIATVIVFFVSRKTNNLALVIIFGVIYALISLRSAYLPFFSDFKVGLKIMEYYEMILNSPIQSFPAGLFWIAIGKVFADGFRINMKPSIIIASSSLVLLFIEWFFIARVTSPSLNNANYYFMLAPLCISLFNIILHFDNLTFKYSLQMRKMSVIIFASHGSILFCVNVLLGLISLSLPSIVIFIIVAALSFGVSILVLFLERFNALKWLSYAY